ncbi:uncharacterized protein LOC123685276 [Harmonia axyridis]|uniref:uncharacterized protein LOC123685276 n=1 Tax=Harmonia axyridis TaxID=115357 RepID=UPI001E278C8A|nr:uncharacterized protein LOC123685276 [Harmonia axyridis]
MRWSEEENILLMRVHFIALEMQELTGRTYRQISTETWNEIYPERRSYPNLLANRVRWILQNGKFSSMELDSIMQSVSPLGAEVQEEMGSTENGTQVETRVSFRQTGTERRFSRNLQLFSGMGPEKRPKLPRMKGSVRLLQTVRKIDDVLNTCMRNSKNIEEILDMVYAAAVTVCEEVGIHLGNNQPTHRKDKTPPWKIRLEKKIDENRRKIGVIHTYLHADSPSRKLLKKTLRVASEYRVRSRSWHLREELVTICDRLKQKVKTLGNRLKRYNERVKRYRNNELYYKNPQQFFRSLEEGVEAAGEESLSLKKMYREWNEIWGDAKTHDDGAYWIKEAERKAETYDMEELEIKEEDIRMVLRRARNWSAPGSDGLHNYWWKNFQSTHKHLARMFQEALHNPSVIPESLTLGVTHMIPKGDKTSDPKNYRPITCLPSIYKILTGVLTTTIWRHVDNYGIMAPEQNGCRKNIRGCKEALIVDHLVTKQARKKLRNISVAWIDYKKAFDSMPHSWLLKILRLYGVSESVVKLLEHLMKSWRTQLLVTTQGKTTATPEIKIRRGIFQGDKLSPLWFCLALNFLSKLLRDDKYGYIIERRRNTKINHQLHIDDLKLYASSEGEMKRMLKIVASFSETVRMEMGLSKCAVVHVQRGKLVEGDEMQVQDSISIRRMGLDETYKYLGVQQGLEINLAESKATFKEKFFGRLRKVLASKLNSRSMFTAINTWAVPCIAYSFGVVRWSTTELQSMDTRVRVLLTKYGIHHPHASVSRLYVPRKDGGRGLQSLEIIPNNVVKDLRGYFQTKNSPLFKVICQEDENITALNLSDRRNPTEAPTIGTLTERWHGMTLHGRYPEALKNNNVNKEQSLEYITAGYLYPETEGRLVAIQDQVVPTRAYIKNITKRYLPSNKCRKCSQGLETIQHVTSSCSILAPKEYTDRHNAMAKVYHQAIAIRTGLILTSRKPYEYVPKAVMENENYRLYWDTLMETDRPVAHNRPDIVIFDKVKKGANIIDVTVPADDSISRAYTEKITKYEDLAFEQKEIYDLRKVYIIPLIITTNGLVETHLGENTALLGLDQDIISTAQKEVVLWTTRIVRKFLVNG